MDQARGKAESLAAHADLVIGAITSIHVQEDQNMLRQRRHMNDSGSGVSGPQAQFLSSQVRVSFETF